jgi:hypothetical protein
VGIIRKVDGNVVVKNLNMRRREIYGYRRMDILRDM